MQAVDADSQSEVEIDFSLNGRSASLFINAESNVSKNTLLKRSQKDCVDFGEEPVQLLEGCFYEYELPDHLSLNAISGVVIPSRRNPSRGQIKPGIYVGRLALTVENDLGDSVELAVEVRSIKAEYRSEYQAMLEDITTECTELLMLHSSAVTQRYSVDYSVGSATLYQRFSFVKSIVDSVAFRHAVQRVMSMPVTAWMESTEELDIRRSHRLGAKQVRQLCSRNNRIKLSSSHPLASRLGSVPSRLSSSVKTDTVDTPENRFVKHALKEFERFCGSICNHIENNQSASNNKLPAIYHEAKALEARLSEYLSHSLFREIQPASSLRLNSPVLQRKQGYREILRVWLMYDLAAKLVWNALDEDSYQVGKRDVATLYEYWLFFKLLRLVEEIFEVEAKETKQLIKATSDGLSLQLLAGKHTAVKGVHKFKGREFNVQFNFNRTFGKSDYPKQGSWTQSMRPDYTLSLWPRAFSESEAEEQELIVHVHFDAKYKVDDLRYLTEPDSKGLSDDELLTEKNIQKEGTYKRADLLKMHAYKDAIRRTVGAYVLYPGSKVYKRKGFHEVVPGLGAFPISPSHSNSGLDAVRNFITEVVSHFSNRASQRERLSYHAYDIYKHTNEDKVNEMMPEYAVDSVVRPIPPAEATVLIAYYNKNQYEWIKESGLYNIRLDGKGLQIYGVKEAGATYLLLRTSGSTKTADIWEIVGKAPTMMTKKELINKGYPREPSCENYLVYSIKLVESGVFGVKKWDIKNLSGYSSNRADKARPFAVSLSELLLASV